NPSSPAIGLVVGFCAGLALTGACATKENSSGAGRTTLGGGGGAAGAGAISGKGSSALARSALTDSFSGSTVRILRRIASAVFLYFCGLSRQGCSSIRTRAFSISRSMPRGNCGLAVFSSVDIRLSHFLASCRSSGLHGREIRSRRARYRGDKGVSNADSGRGNSHKKAQKAQGQRGGFLCLLCLLWLFL